MTFDKKTDCPVLIVMGQSNAHGHGTRLPKKLEITRGLQNVYGLSREKNQFYHLDNVTWSNYTSCGMNLGEKQDHTWCLATEFARKWQQKADREEQLPDLYVIQISIGAQGVNEHEAIMDDPDAGNRIGMEMNMWYPDRKIVMDITNPELPNVSLYPLAIAILHLAMKSIREMGKNPVILGLHWNQWEAEAIKGGDAVKSAYTNYSRLWNGFEEALGMTYPLYLYRPLSKFEGYQDQEDVERLEKVFERFARERKNTKILDAGKALGQMEKTLSVREIFMEDGVHYKPVVHEWFAKQQFEDVFSLGI